MIRLSWKKGKVLMTVIYKRKTIIKIRTRHAVCIGYTIRNEKLGSFRIL